ncbi:MAG: ribonuclease P protein component 1 [Haloferacaceae archaeon]
MPLTPETLPRHELVGLHASVAAAPNPDLVGVAGRVVRETRNTLVLAPAGDDGPSRAEARQVPKRATTFEFRLGVATDEAAGSEASRASPCREVPGTDGNPTGGSGHPNGGSGHPNGGSSHPGDASAHVTVDGGCLLSRPARRTENAPTPGGDDRWR